LEAKFSKAEILEFYLNQVPYARQRRGIAQAARLYFDRDLDLLNQRETLALVVLVRSPSRMDLLRSPTVLNRSIDRMSHRLALEGLISDREFELVRTAPMVLREGQLATDASHFVRHVLAGPQPGGSDGASVSTSLDSTLQKRLRSILDGTLRDLVGRDTSEGAILVADYRTDEVLAWVNGGGRGESKPGSWIDAVTLPRQPGSTLKPFLYSLALEKGWTAATLLDDSPLSEPLGSGVHVYRNYSRIHYGPLPLREALGNSLNIPAVRTIQFTGTGAFLHRLRELGFANLNQTPDFYGHGLALGDGEVSLLELVQAYACLARGGRFRLLRWTVSGAAGEARERQVIPEDVASLVAHILSDPQARRLEFGEGNLLNFPVQTAVKTGTSSDHRDTWAIGFSRRHVAGVWMGNLDRTPTRGLTGTTGPGLVLRAVFAELNRNAEPGSIPISSHLVRVEICQKSGRRPGRRCPVTSEFFVPGSEPAERCELHHDLESASTAWGPERTAALRSVELIQPPQGLELAMDPRVPDSLEAFSLILPGGLSSKRVEWIVDGNIAGTTGPGSCRFDWIMQRGHHTAQARVWLNESESSEFVETPPVPFSVR
jgi:penicillin-binding protein 1C